MANLLVVGILFLAVGAAVSYIVKAKKSGTKCIGCPSGGCCSKKSGCHTEGGCGCHGTEK
ncbi:FeoB-associated Cys-rich membrane protein [Blautia sp. Marseille-P3201T]|uniref:FeoB-associated Cys-rich membrane protein n=1 Tax=Blautia sp. Marseille-P3201T TaxID=1907659 RepID=UPI00093203BB|nr:FeoB-associated Cys-rich membrane protein [Blautia sp. Marseille-P3201T]